MALLVSLIQYSFVCHHQPYRQRYCYQDYLYVTLHRIIPRYYIIPTSVAAYYLKALKSEKLLFYLIILQSHHIVYIDFMRLNMKCFILLYGYKIESNLRKRVR